MSSAPRSSHQAAIRAAVDATGSARGWLLGIADGGFVVLAVHGTGRAGAEPGDRIEALGAAGFAAASGQPAAMRLDPDDADNNGAGDSPGVPEALLVVPCGVDDVVGVIEVVDPAAGSYTFDDVETVSLVAELAGAMLGEEELRTSIPSPAELGEALSTLAASDPVRYRLVAAVVEALT